MTLWRWVSKGRKVRWWRHALFGFQRCEAGCQYVVTAWADITHRQTDIQPWPRDCLAGRGKGCWRGRLRAVGGCGQDMPGEGGLWLAVATLPLEATLNCSGSYTAQLWQQALHTARSTALRALHRPYLHLSPSDTHLMTTVVRLGRQTAIRMGLVGFFWVGGGGGWCTLQAVVV